MALKLPGIGSNYTGTVKDKNGDILYGGKSYKLTQQKSWFLVLRLYSPLEPFYDKTWKPGELEPVN